MESNICLRTKVLEENQKAHDYYAHLHDRVCSYLVRGPCKKFYGQLIQELSKKDLKSKTVLELGCGTGTWAFLFPESDFVGVDISEGMIQKAREKYPHRRFVANDVKSFLEEEIHQGREYDLIISSSFIHHLYDIDEVIDLIGKVLKTNGSYVAIHEPRMSQGISPQRGIGLRIDTYLAFLFGYDCDLTANPLWKRVLSSFKKLIPFKKTIKNLLPQKYLPQHTKHDHNFVDAQLAEGKTFHPVVFANKIYPHLTINFDFYTYYTFPFLRNVFGDSMNYFWIKFEKKE